MYIFKYWIFGGRLLSKVSQNTFKQDREHQKCYVQTKVCFWVRSEEDGYTQTGVDTTTTASTLLQTRNCEYHLLWNYIPPELTKTRTEIVNHFKVHPQVHSFRFVFEWCFLLWK